MKTRYVYCICYLDNKYCDTIKDDLNDLGFYNVKPIIPTVRIMKVNSRSKVFYIDVPVLFNYGFIKMPSEYAYSRDILNCIKSNVAGIRGWVKSPEPLHRKRKRSRIDNLDIFDDFSVVATIEKSEVRRFQKISRQNKRFSIDNLMNVSIGDYIILKGYPYDGIDATILGIDYNNRTVKLMLYPENGKMEINLPFDNVIYSVYENFNPDCDGRLLNYNDDNNITSNSIDRVYDIKSY